MKAIRPFSNEVGTYAATLEGHVAPELMAERLAEAGELQDSVTSRRRRLLIGTKARVLVDRPGVARSHREAPEIDGIIRLDPAVPTGTWVDVEIIDAEGPDLDARVLDPAA
jgi:ribosomal protein S12 methylthiotransferase